LHLFRYFVSVDLDGGQMSPVSFGEAQYFESRYRWRYLAKVRPM
jgi:hypothetical protein